MAFALGNLGLARFLNVFDIVLENEKIGRALPRQANERLVVILDCARDFFAIRQLHAYLHGAIDQTLEILHLFKGLLRRARRLSTLL
jgi:hypothetical protein